MRRLVEVFPSDAFADTSHGIFMNAKMRGQNGSVTTSRKEMILKLSGLFRGQVAHILPPCLPSKRHRVLGVSSGCYVLQVARRVVSAIGVNVVNAMTFRAWANKSSGNQGMYGASGSVPFNTRASREFDHGVAVAADCGGKNSDRLAARVAIYPPNPTQAAYLIRRVIRHCSPFLTGKVGGPLIDTRFAFSHSALLARARRVKRPQGFDGKTAWASLNHWRDYSLKAAGFLSFVLLFSSSAAQAQSSRQILKPCEDAIDELRVRRVEVEGLKQQLVLKDERDAAKDQLIANLEQTILFWKEAATARKEALTIDDRIEKIRLEQIVEYKAEIDRLRAENDKLRRGKTKWLMAGVVLGVVMPKFP